MPDQNDHYGKMVLSQAAMARALRQPRSECAPQPGRVGGDERLFYASDFVLFGRRSWLIDVLGLRGLQIQLEGDNPETPNVDLCATRFKSSRTGVQEPVVDGLDYQGSIHQEVNFIAGDFQTVFVPAVVNLPINGLEISLSHLPDRHLAIVQASAVAMTVHVPRNNATCTSANPLHFCLNRVICPAPQIERRYSDREGSGPVID